MFYVTFPNKCVTRISVHASRSSAFFGGSTLGTVGTIPGIFAFSFILMKL